MLEAAKEQRLKQINARFKAATPQRFRQRWQPSIPFLLTGVAMLGLVGTLLMFSIPRADPIVPPMSGKQRVRHLLAFPNCTAARLAGVAPAHRGEPGYWLDHDADGDGIACEPLRTTKRL